VRLRPATALAAATLAGIVACLAGCGSAQAEAGETTQAFYESLARGDFPAACAKIDASLRDQLSGQGTPCESSLAEEYDAARRARMGSVVVDREQIVVQRDSARVPESAVTFNGTPSDLGDTDLVERDGVWVITGGG
jgi:hypothetical protein